MLFCSNFQCFLMVATDLVVKKAWLILENSYKSLPCAFALKTLDHEETSICVFGK